MEYLVIPQWRLVIEIDSIEDIEDSEEESINEIINEQNVESPDIGNLEVADLTIGEIANLYKLYETMQSAAGMDANMLLLFWLRNKCIDYTIECDIEQFKTEGYTIVSTEE